MGMYKKTLRVALGLSIALLGTAAYATTTLTGTNVSYTFDETGLGKFGSAAVSGDSLVFSPLSPNSFMATSSGTGSAFETVHVTVTANSGYQLSAFNLSETGGYSLSGDGAVYVTGEFGALDVEGTTGNYLPAPIEAVPGSFSSTSTSGSWAAKAAMTLPATGWGGVDGSVGSVSLKISNQLFAFAGSGSASIYKDFVGISAFTTAVTPVPEAQTYAMMLVGLGLVGFMVRRTRSRV